MKKVSEITPIMRVVSPKYPDRYAVDLKPFLLNNRPLRWQAAPVAGTVLSAVVMLGLAGCVTMGEPQPLPLEVPLFEHGEGIGGYVCISVTAPMFLSEEDAFAIVSEEFAKIDRVVHRSEAVVKNIDLPIWVYPKDDYAYKGEMGSKKGSFTYDFVVEGAGIEMEFVSTSDLWEWNSAISDEFGGASYHFKDAARVLNDGLNAKQNRNVHGVFYDPAEYTDNDDWMFEYGWMSAEEWEAAKEEVWARAIEQLRLQVQDFIAWLAAQGII